MVESDRPEAGVPLATAFAALPLEAPERSAWPQLRPRLVPPAQAPARRWAWQLALAAGLLAWMLAPRSPPPPGAGATAASATAGAAATTADLATLMSESARLERLVAASSDDGASSASTAALGLELEDRLHALDAELEASRDPARQLALWQRRVQLLRNVAALEASRHYLASEGRNLDVALVAAY
jgi:hypothetical protein